MRREIKRNRVIFNAYKNYNGRKSDMLEKLAGDYGVTQRRIQQIVRDEGKRNHE